MSDFIIAIGHTASGNVGCGVIDRLDESRCTREIGALALEYLMEKGHGVNLLRVDESNTYKNEDCYVRANQANDIAKYSEVELYVEIHINAGGGTGPEVFVFKSEEKLMSKYGRTRENIITVRLRVEQLDVEVFNGTYCNGNEFSYNLSVTESELVKLYEDINDLFRPSIINY
jgi:N-acetylmuramoyl-L-alanine amidase